MMARSHPVTEGKVECHIISSELGSGENGELIDYINHLIKPRRKAEECMSYLKTIINNARLSKLHDVRLCRKCNLYCWDSYAENNKYNSSDEVLCCDARFHSERYKIDEYWGR
jgi:hypothetical protein